MSTESVPKTSPGAPKPTISIPRIPGMPPDMPMQQELATYLLAAPRLIADGQTGRYALIKAADILGLYDSSTEVLEAGYERFGLDEPFAVYKINPQDLERVAAMAAREGVPWPP